MLGKYSLVLSRVLKHFPKWQTYYNVSTWKMHHMCIFLCCVHSFGCVHECGDKRVLLVYIVDFESQALQHSIVNLKLFDVS
jgi:hypothetical protein